MQEQPEPVQLVQADLDEVVARAEGAQLQAPVRRDLLGAVRAIALLQGLDPPGGLRAVDGRVVMSGRQRTARSMARRSAARSPRLSASPAVDWVRTAIMPQL